MFFSTSVENGDCERRSMHHIRQYLQMRMATVKTLNGKKKKNNDLVGSRSCFDLIFMLV